MRTFCLRVVLCLLLMIFLGAALARAADDPDLPPGTPAALKDEVRRTYRVLLVGTRCYLASTIGVVVADCHDPTRPRYLGSLVLPDSVNDLTLVGGRLAIADGPSGVTIAELGDRPRRLGSVVLSGAAMGVAAQGNKLLVASGSAGLHVLDVSDPARPHSVDHWETAGYAREVRVEGELVALADGDHGVHMFQLHGGRLRHLSSVQPPGTQAHVFALAFSGSLLLAAAGPAGLAVFEVSKPERPTLLGRLAVRDGARGVSVQGHRAALADGTAGVALCDLQNPAAPRETGRFKTERSANRVVVDGNLAYVANDYDGLLILRLPEKSGDPVPIGRLPAPKKKK